MWFRDRLDKLSRIQFYLWRLSGNRFEAMLRLKTGAVVLLRPQPFQDISIATEVFATDAYAVPSNITIQPESIRFIVDLGANVGYTCVYWTEKFRQAEIVAFEPHPRHIKQIHKHLKINPESERVKLIPKAAGIEYGKLNLTDDEFSSELVAEATEKTISVDVVDWINEINGRPIDLLKMDIEGSEYTLLSDVRFSQLNIPLCVIEWHDTEKHPKGRKWCEEKLDELGYDFCEGKGTSPTNGLLWAWKNQ